MRSDDTLLAGVRPGPGDGLKVRLFLDGHIEIALLNPDGHAAKELSLAGIADLEVFCRTVTRAVIRHRELNSGGDSYLQGVRRALAPQVENVENALLHAKP
ncbi:MAG: hypothetical protein ACYCR5_06575 [Leptospirillum sp.]